MIRRDEHKENYTVVANGILTDERLSFEARWFLVYLLSFPDDWNFNVRNLAKSLGCSTDKIVRLSKELKESGYISQKQKSDSKGHFSAIEWEVSENCTAFENHRVRKTPNTAKTEHGCRVRETPCSEKPHTDFPEHGKVEHLLNTNNNQILNIQNTNKEPNTQEETRVLSDAEKLFLEFWAIYPKKVDKKGAFRAFKNIKKLKEVFPEIMSALEIQKRSEQWTKANGQYIPNPTTYIHQERWTTTTEADEIKANLDQMFLENINQFNPWRRKDA